jgi:hypothetical protein
MSYILLLTAFYVNNGKTYLFGETFRRSRIGWYLLRLARISSVSNSSAPSTHAG